MKIRMKFSKQGPVKYVGHLDTMRLFQRAIKVARIPVAYSQGFSPHSLVYFALPLAVGVSSTGEYMDMITKEAVNPMHVKEELNSILVEGIKITEAFVVDDKMDSLMSLVQAADYQIQLIVSDKMLVKEKMLKILENNSELMVMKKSKRGIISVDIRPLILNTIISENEEGLLLEAKVVAGSSQNLNPELLVKALMGEEELSYTMQVTRKEMYTSEHESFIPLYTFGIVE